MQAGQGWGIGNPVSWGWGGNLAPDQVVSVVPWTLPELLRFQQSQNGLVRLQGSISEAVRLEGLNQVVGVMSRNLDRISERVSDLQRKVSVLLRDSRS
jgi:hypothetical protein